MSVAFTEIYMYKLIHQVGGKYIYTLLSQADFLVFFLASLLAHLMRKSESVVSLSTPTVLDVHFISTYLLPTKTASVGNKVLVHKRL